MATVLATASTTYAATTSVTVTKPAGLSVGDLMVAQCSVVANTPSNFSTPAGWTSLSTVTVGEARQTVFYKIADAGDVAAGNFSFAAGVSEQRAAGIIAISDISLVTTITETNTSALDSGSGTLTMSTQSPLRSDSVVLILASGGEQNVAPNYVFSSPALATDNPTWTGEWQLNDVSAGHSGTMYLASAERSAATATGNATVAYASGGGGTDAIAHFIVINDKAAASHTPDSNIITTTVPPILVNPPYITGVNSSPAVTTKDLPTQWTNEAKPSTTWVNEQK